MRVSVIAALSADGFIARQTDELVNWSSSEDKKLFVELTKRAGVMVMGSTTFKTIGRALPGRKTVVYSKGGFSHPDVTVTDMAPARLLEQLQAEGYDEVAICGGSSIYALFLQSKVVTDIYLTIEPQLFGQGVPLASSMIETSLRLAEHRLLNENTIMLHYEVH